MHLRACDRLLLRSLQTCVRFSPDDNHLVVTNGLKRVIFWSWAEGSWKYYSPPVSLRDFKQPIGDFTQSIYIPGTELAATGTVVCWHCGQWGWGGLVVSAIKWVVFWRSGGGGHFLHPVEDFEISSKKQMECVFQHNLNYLAKKKSSHTYLLQTAHFWQFAHHNKNGVQFFSVSFRKLRKTNQNF